MSSKITNGLPVLTFYMAISILATVSGFNFKKKKILLRNSILKIPIA